jgi:AraC-like DNA-binding protein
VVCAGWEECSTDYRIERRGFPYLAVEYIVRGHWLLNTGGNEYALEPGVVFAYHPKSTCSLRSKGETPGLKYFVDFSGRRGAVLLRSSGLASGEPLPLRGIRWIRDLLDQILECAPMDESGADEISTRLLEVLLLRVGEARRSAIAPQAVSQLAYARCAAYIRDHYAALRSMGEVAKACHVSTAYLSRLFARHGNERASDLLVRLKMSLAASLLTRGNSSVKEVAAAAGYEDPYHFSRVFRKAHGVAPSHFAARLCAVPVRRKR